MDKNLDMSRHCALAAQKANNILGCIKRMASREREGIATLCSTLMKPHPEYLCPCLGSPAQDGHGAVGEGPDEGQKDRAPLL